MLKKLKDEQKILAAAVLGAAALWIIDAGIDSFVFREGTFWVSLLGGITLHELYFRSIFVSTIILFGFIISRFLKMRRQAEESLRKAVDAFEDERTKSETVIAAIADGISIQDREFRVLYQNEMHKRLVGDHLGERCYKAYVHQDSVCSGCPVAEAFKDGNTHVREKTRTDEKGTVHIEIYASALRNAAGEVVAGIEAVRDITEHKLLEDSLQEQKKFAENVIENSAVATFVLSPDHKVLLWNKACERLTGVPASRMINTGDHWRPFYPEKREMLADILIEKNFEALPKLYQAFARSILVPEGLQAEGWYRDLNGQDRYINFDAIPIYSTKGDLVVVIETLQDITERKRAEEAVREASERLRTLLETIPDAVYFKDSAGRHVIVNKATEKLVGRSRDEIIGRTAEELFPPDAAAYCRMSDENALRSRMPFFCEEKITRPDGETLYVETIKAPLYDGRGAAVGITAISRDITERKRAGDALKESEGKYKNLVELTTDIIYRSDKNGNQVFMNDAAFKALGYSPEEVIGKPVINLIHPDDRQRTWEKRQEMIERGIDVFNFENRYVTKSGKAINVLHNVRVLRNEQGEIIGTQGIARDITERKRAEEKLRLFSEAIEEAMDGVQIVDLNGRIMYSNKAVEEIYGFSADELRGKHVNEMNADPTFAERVILPALRETGRWNGELTVRHKDGREFPIWLSASTVKNDKGEPIAMVGIIRDITERKQTEYELRAHREHLEELVRERAQDLVVANERLQKEVAERRRMEEDLIRAQKLESLSLLAGGIAHDFNNLLASMMGNISLTMLDFPQESAAYQQLASAERAALRARELTLQLLTFSKGGAPVKTYSSMEQVIRDTADFSLRGSKARLEFSFPGDLWPVEVDQGQMAQVINNLIINADQAMPEGGMITITGENMVLGPSDVLPLEEGNYVRITVKDRGIGIPKEYLSKIFDPYFTTKQKGSGLGLAITYSIIQKHDGFISVDSEVGAGTTFRIFLPAASERRTASRPREATLVAGTGRILVMDDEEDVRKTTGDILTRLGYTVAFAEDGAQAIDLYRQAWEAGAPFDLAIMDLTVPGGMGGKDAVKKLLEIDPRAKIVVSSGYSKDPVMAEYGNYGFKGVVAKPFRVKDLSETIHRIMNGHP